MPFLNSRGDVAHGVGGGFCNVNNVKVAFGGVCGWWDDDTVVFFNGDDNWLTSLYHVPTKTITRLDGVFGVPAGGVSGNHGFCSGQQAASWWLGSNGFLPDGVTPIGGLWSTVDGLHKSAAGLMGMGPDNALAYKPDYQSMGPTLYRRPDGSEWEITPGSTELPCLLGEDRILWMEGLRPHVRNLPPLTTAPGNQWFGKAAFVGGQWWYGCYSDLHGVILHPFSFQDKLGYSVLPLGNAWVTVRALTDQVVRVCWADHIEEQAGQLHARDYDVLAGLMLDPWSATPAWQPAPLVEITKINYVPPAVGTASFALDTTAARVGEKVTATLTHENLTTWRWTLDPGGPEMRPQGGTIHKDVNGQADNLVHEFILKTEGLHTIGMRCVAPAGSVEVPVQVVTAQPAAPPTPPTFKVGCQTGFGYPVGPDVLTVMAQKEWAVQRIGIDGRTPSKDWLLACIEEVHAYGLLPLSLLPIYIPGAGGSKIRIVDWVPEGEHIEIYGLEPDLTEMGAEQDLKNGPAEAIAREIDALMPMFRAKNQTIYAGCTSNFSRKSFAWLKRFCDTLQSEDVIITIHRYPDYGTRTSKDPRKEWKNREEEYKALKVALGKHTLWGVTESGWHVGKYWKREGDLLKWLDKIWPGFNSFTLGRKECAENCLGDAKWVRDHGGLIYIWFQAWEGKDPDSGLRDINNVWQPAADMPLRLKGGLTLTIPRENWVRRLWKRIRGIMW
jgi:hypothetical protein